MAKQDQKFWEPGNAAKSCFFQMQTHSKKTKMWPTENSLTIADNITARWDGLPMPKQPNVLDADDVGTLLTSQMEGDEEGQAPLTCSQKIVKVMG